MKKNYQMIINGLFICIILAFLLIGLCRTVFLPKERNYYENRYANQIKPLTQQSYSDGSFQNGLEDALNDQIPLAQSLKSRYNFINAKYLYSIASPLLKDNSDKYINTLGAQTFGGEHLVYSTYDLDSIKEELNNKANNFNEQIKKNSNADFYVYYIEKDTDINFETSEKNGVFEYLSKKINLPSEKISKFEINSFDDFKQNFYKTDHHWNCYGSYSAYQEILSMIKGDEEALIPVNEKKEIGVFSGSKANTSGASGVIKESFPAYEFIYPTMDIVINNIKSEDYGNQDAYLKDSNKGNISYGMFYGGDDGEIIFDTHQDSKENILIIGESYDNAILKLLASHFNKTYSIDLRNYEPHMNKTFQFSKYIKDYDITKVLLIGNIDYFVSESFMLED